MNYSATCRLNATLRERCLAMASVLQKPDKGGQIMDPKLITRRGAPQLVAGRRLNQMLVVGRPNSVRFRPVIG